MFNRKKDKTCVERVVAHSTGFDEARESRLRMRDENQSVNDQWPIVNAVSQELYAIRERNHFADMIMSAMNGEKK